MDRSQLEVYNENIRLGRWRSKPFDRDDPLKRVSLSLLSSSLLSCSLLSCSLLVLVLVRLVLVRLVLILILILSGVGADEQRLLGLSWTYYIPKCMNPPSILFEQPLCAELMGAGFQKIPFSEYYELRWPRLQKIFPPDERRWVEGPFSRSPPPRLSHNPTVMY